MPPAIKKCVIVYGGIDVKVLSTNEVKNLLNHVMLELNRILTQITISVDNQIVHIEVPYVGKHAQPYFSYSPKYLYKTELNTFEFKDPFDDDDDDKFNNSFYGDIVEFPNMLINVSIFQNFCQRIIELLEEKSKGELVRPYFESKKGVINWDIPFTPKQWLIDILKECNKLKYLEPSLQNPSIEDDGTVSFLRSGLSLVVNDEILFFLNKLTSAKIIIQNMYILTIHDEHLLESFLKSDKQIAVLTFSFRVDVEIKHARFVFKDSGRLIVMDPWMQSIHFPWINVCERNGYTYEFKARKKDQGHEGSCLIVAMARAFMIALEGFESIDAPLDHSILILVHMLMSEFRDKYTRNVETFTNTLTFNKSR